MVSQNYRLCGLVVRVPGYGSRGPGFGSRRYQIFLKSSESAKGSTQPRGYLSYLKEKVAAPVKKTENTAVGICCADHTKHLSAKVGTNFADKRRPLGRIVSSWTQAT
jgi:hypothetical protein